MKNKLASRQAGFTLIEACIVFAVIATLLGSAVPAFQQTLISRNLEGVATQVATDFMHVRSEAVARNDSVRVTFQAPSGGTCYVVHTGGAKDCVCHPTGPALCSNGARELKTVFLPDSGKVRVQSNVASMLFEPVHGTTVLAGTIRVTASSGAEIRQVVNIMGRPQACSPGGAVRGYKPCKT